MRLSTPAAPDSVVLRPVDGVLIKDRGVRREVVEADACRATAGAHAMHGLSKERGREAERRTDRSRLVRPRGRFSWCGG